LTPAQREDPEEDASDAVMFADLSKDGRRIVKRKRFFGKGSREKLGILHGLIMAYYGCVSNWGCSLSTSCEDWIKLDDSW
jgi:hypothetical protein